ncbi:hypothetical protein HRR83_000502 [Exophiala dermatitidis]|uniref:Zn(2)-C6 fungal-type domain-containing protein n=1 Tax=Exophiala dermatitidis TaxID=5970 RepID=A0AAN6F3L4_EXODE|nr:hypothetical protein HRR74_000503 [Exophiala dermatitidis]KAJ4528384.1 hypothetical protein HRR73_001007 [Exophiala dermatitidis]KAJ4590217.1 hypothetical protein HRR82_000589 [Exophiala dermatitidis]KAJ4607285.1 hypothetical protein HRR84_000589 [Exophiala dermatitidis]KAJ4608278.1 hypothetical protein HRR83_000502 [Exophiala dermatitidis]
MPSPPTARAIQPLNDGLSSQSSQPPHSLPPKKRQPSARISAACEACKKRKTKCTGGPPPCQLCQSLGTQCVIDLSLDMRRRAALQRTLDESKAHQDNLNTLLDGIRAGPSNRLDALVGYIRGGASNDEVADIIQKQWDPAGNQDLDHPMAPQGNEMDYVHTNEAEGQNRPAGDHLDNAAPDAQVTPTASETSTSTDSGSRKRNEVAHSPDMSKLLAALKNSSIADGEDLIRQFMTSLPWDERGHSTSTGSISSTISPSSDGGVQSNPQPTMAARSGWHPALQARTEPIEGEKLVQGKSADQPMSLSSSPVDAASARNPASADSSRTQASSKRQKTLHPTIKTEGAQGTEPVASPTSPYLEQVTSHAHSAPAIARRDLCVAQDGASTRLRIPVHLVLPLTVTDDSSMSRTYSHYLQAAHQMLEAGVPLSYLLGSPDQVVVDLFFRPREANDIYTCASWACEVCRSYDHDIFVRLGCVFLLTSMMRWLLAPTLENYERLPDMMKPTPLQCMIPHIGAIETIPLPPVRDAVIHRLRDWLTPLKRAEWSINWPHGLDAAIMRDDATGATVLTPSFMEHAGDYDNWSVSRVFLDDFPEVAGRIRIHDG